MNNTIHEKLVRWFVYHFMNNGKLFFVTVINYITEHADNDIICDIMHGEFCKK